MFANDASERLFQDKVIQLARMNGWDIFHPTPHKVGQTWRSDGVGFPDLVLAHPDRGVIFAELKTERGKLLPAQKKWALALLRYGEYYVWRPNQLQLIAERLGGPQVPDGLKL